MPTMARRLPSRRPDSIPPQTMTAIPASAAPIASHVSPRTRSPRNRRASSADRKGSAPRMNTTFAIVVWNCAHTTNTLPTARPADPIAPKRPIETNARHGTARDWIAIASTTASAQEAER